MLEHWYRCLFSKNNKALKMVIYIFIYIMEDYISLVRYKPIVYIQECGKDE